MVLDHLQELIALGLGDHKLLENDVARREGNDSFSVHHELGLEVGNEQFCEAGEVDDLTAHDHFFGDIDRKRLLYFDLAARVIAFDDVYLSVRNIK